MLGVCEQILHGKPSKDKSVHQAVLTLARKSFEDDFNDLMTENNLDHKLKVLENIVEEKKDRKKKQKAWYIL